MMKITKKDKRIEEYIDLVQEWKASGMTQTKFADVKGISRSALKYRIHKVRQLTPDELSKYQDMEFVQISKECISDSVFHTDSQLDYQPVLTFQTGGLSFQATNRISPKLLKTVLEVMSAC